MTYFKNLDSIMKQDPGRRGLLPSLPPSPLAELTDSLRQARRVVLLTGFPVRMMDGSVTGETDGPSGTANLAAAFLETGCSVFVITDRFSYPLLEAALRFRAPASMLTCLPQQDTDPFIRSFLRDTAPTHFISLERPGKAADGHYHNMRGEIIDDMVTDSALFLPEARRMNAAVISIGDGGNEMGMGSFCRQIARSVPFGNVICANDQADLTLAGGVSNWWGWGIASLLSLTAGRSLLPTPDEETELLRRVVAAGGADGCTRKTNLTVDTVPLESYLSVLSSVRLLTDCALRNV
jgi:hypothetical protein